MNKPVAAIIVNWNGLEDTIACLESILKLAYPALQVVVVDNGSKINEAELLEKLYGSKIHSLRNNFNRGYSAGINFGIKFVIENFPEIDYFLISNNDVTFKQNFLEGLIHLMETNPNAGVACGKILITGSRNIIFSIGQTWNLKTGFVRNEGFGLDNLANCQRVKEIDFVPGAVFVVKKELIKRIGLFDEEYFLYFEEPDFCIRAKRAGYKIYLVPESITFHKPASSTRKVSLFSHYCYEKSHLRFITKHFGKNLPIVLLLHFVIILTNESASSIRHRNPACLLLATKAIVETVIRVKKIRISTPEPIGISNE